MHIKSLYKNKASKSFIHTLYHKKLDDLNIKHQSIYIDTTFGKTHILKTGSSKSPPLLLVHGANGCAPIALDCYPNLDNEYQVFAIDVMAQPNKSGETRLEMNDDSYGQWLHEIISTLRLKNVVLVAFSLGGLIILKTLEHREDNIKEVFLASPAYIVNGNPLRALFKLFITLKRYIRNQELKHLNRIIDELFTNAEPFAKEFLSVVFAQFEQDFSPVPVITKRAAQRIRTPITILGAGNDIIFPGNKMKRRAAKIFPSLRKFVLLADSKHVQDTEGNKIFEKLILSGQHK